MIKIDLDSTPKGGTKYLLAGSVEVRGEICCLAHEIYSVLKEFEKSAPESLEIAMSRLVYEMPDELEEV
jgi:hypothetical protein